MRNRASVHVLVLTRPFFLSLQEHLVVTLPVKPPPFEGPMSSNDDAEHACWARLPYHHKQPGIYRWHVSVAFETTVLQRHGGAPARMPSSCCASWRPSAAAQRCSGLPQ